MTDSKAIEEGSKLQCQFDKRGGLLPVIVQEQDTGLILMLGYTNTEALDITLKTKLATFWSTSRQAIWVKGETSGNYLRIKEMLIDCDQDALVYQVESLGTGVCHTTNHFGKSRISCFYRKVNWKSFDLEPIEEGS